MSGCVKLDNIHRKTAPERIPERFSKQPEDQATRPAEGHPECPEQQEDERENNQP